METLTPWQRFYIKVAKAPWPEDLAHEKYGYTITCEGEPLEHRRARRIDLFMARMCERDCRIDGEEAPEKAKPLTFASAQRMRRQRLALGETTSADRTASRSR